MLCKDLKSSFIVRTMPFSRLIGDISSTRLILIHIVHIEENEMCTAVLNLIRIVAHDRYKWISRNLKSEFECWITMSMKFLASQNFTPRVHTSHIHTLAPMRKLLTATREAVLYDLNTGQRARVSFSPRSKDVPVFPSSA